MQFALHLCLLLIAMFNVPILANNCETDTCSYKECKKVLKYFIAHVEMVGPDFACNSPIDFSNSSQLLINQQDPFLLLHEFGPHDWKIGENKGVPLHPHAGFESVTYIKTGESKHKDSLGNEKILYSGDTQWLSSGNGILHSESTDHPGGLQHGFQFWVNVKSEYKYNHPKYQFLSHNKSPSININDNIKIKLIVGKYYDDINDKLYTSSITTNANVYILDIMIENDENFVYNIPSDSSFQTFIIYVYQGNGSVKNGNEWIDVSRKSTLYFDRINGNCIELKCECTNENVLGFILMIGQPIQQDIFGDNTDLAKGFIMNTQKQVDEFIEKFKKGTFVRDLQSPQKIMF
eukprot:240867_1